MKSPLPTSFRLRRFGVLLALVLAPLPALAQSSAFATTVPSVPNWQGESSATGAPPGNGCNMGLPDYATADGGTNWLQATAFQTIVFPPGGVPVAVEVAALARYDQGEAATMRMAAAWSGDMQTRGFTFGSPDGQCRWRSWDVTSLDADWTAADLADLEVWVRRANGTSPNNRLRVKAFRVRVTFGPAGPQGTPFCFGVGCPCGNDDPDAGCVNSTGSGAVASIAAGTTSVAADDLVLTASGLPPNNSGLWFSGASTFVPVFVDDGLGCTGGLFRYLPGTVTPSGEFSVTGLVAQAPPGQIGAGDTVSFQAWTRDVLCGPPPTPCPSPCLMGSNLSSGISATFTP